MAKADTLKKKDSLSKERADFKRKHVSLDRLFSFHDEENLRQWFKFFPKELKKNDNDMHLMASMAIIEGIEFVNLLIELGANLNVVHVTNMTPFKVAAHQGKVDVLKVLFEHGAQVNLDTPNHAPALHFAIAGKSLETVKYLIDIGADIKQKNSLGETATVFANRHGADTNPAIMAFLKEVELAFDEKNALDEMLMGCRVESVKNSPTSESSKASKLSKKLSSSDTFASPTQASPRKKGKSL